MQMKGEARQHEKSSSSLRAALKISPCAVAAFAKGITLSCMPCYIISKF